MTSKTIETIEAEITTKVTERAQEIATIKLKIDEQKSILTNAAKQQEQAKKIANREEYEAGEKTSWTARVKKEQLEKQLEDLKKSSLINENEAAELRSNILEFAEKKRKEDLKRAKGLVAQLNEIGQTSKEEKKKVEELLKKVKYELLKVEKPEHILLPKEYPKNVFSDLYYDELTPKIEAELSK